MEFTIGSVESTLTNNAESLKVIPAQKQNRSRDRRKRRTDRRRNVREGIFVSLSGQKDRRRPGDRRKNSI